MTRALLQSYFQESDKMAVQQRRGVPANPFRGGRSPRGGLPTHYSGGGYRSAHHGHGHSPFARLRTVCFVFVVGGMALYTFLGPASDPVDNFSSFNFELSIFNFVTIILDNFL